MLIIKLIRFVLGYVSFKAEGGFSERFVNLCTLNKIPLWNMKRQGNSLFADTTVNGYKSIRQSAHRSGVTLRIQRKHGLPFFLEHNRKRRGILIAVALCLFIAAFLSRFVWSISVEGNHTLTKEQILSAFSRNGVKIGALKSKISPEDVSYETLKSQPELLWASVNIKGSHVEIVVKERTSPPEFPDTAPCNIVASDDGQIISIQANIGTPAVKAGDLVLKGDLLISGVTKNLDGSENFKAARGNVIALTRSEITVSGAPSLFSQTDEKTRYLIYFFGLKIPLGLRIDSERIFTSESYISNGKINLPVGIIKEHFYIADTPTELSGAAASLYNASLYAKRIRHELSSAECVSEQLFFDEASHSFSGVLSLEKDIGAKLEIFIEN